MDWGRRVTFWPCHRGWRYSHWLDRYGDFVLHICIPGNTSWMPVVSVSFVVPPLAFESKICMFTFTENICIPLKWRGDPSSLYNQSGTLRPNQRSKPTPDSFFHASVSEEASEGCRGRAPYLHAQGFLPGDILGCRGALCAWIHPSYPTDRTSLSWKSFFSISSAGDDTGQELWWRHS